MKNQFTEIFFDQSFDPYRDQTRIDEAVSDDNIWTSDLPGVEIPGFCTDIVDTIYRRCLELDHLFVTNTTQTNGELGWWQKCVPSPGWTDINIQSLAFDHYRFLNQQSYQYTQKPQCQDELLQESCRSLFLDRGLETVRIKIAKLSPGGSIHPHLDPIGWDGLPLKLSYFWMPLHEFNPCLRLFPWGTYQTQVGNMYLLNTSRYAHSVINRDNKSRFVLLGAVSRSDENRKILNAYFQATRNDPMRLWKT